MKKRSVFLFLLLVFLFGLYPQAAADDSGMVSTQFDMSGFPQWARDLRRAEIVTFGSFPIMYLFTNLGTGLIAPDRFTTGQVLLMAASGAVLVGIVDFGIVRHRRRRQSRESESISPGTPIIIQRPLFGEDAEAGPQETAESTNNSVPDTGSP